MLLARCRLLRASRTSVLAYRQARRISANSKSGDGQPDVQALAELAQIEVTDAEVSAQCAGLHTLPWDCAVPF